MTKARNIADLLDANGDVNTANLDNVPASNNASALTTGTLPNARLPNNISDTGTEGTKVASGTTGERGSTAGQIRFNSTTGLAEYYTGTAFKSIDSPPTISSLDVTEVDSQAGGNQTIVITGSGFGSGATVTYVGASGTDFNASTVTVNSATQITAVAPKASFLNAQEPYGVKVVNTSALSATLASQINVDTSPSWNTASGSLGTLDEGASANVSATATDADGDTIVYSVQSGSLPAGTSLNTSTGAITGTLSNVNADTTSNFTLRATANSKNSDRAFSIIVINNLMTTADFFADSSGKSLYMFDNNGTDTGGIGNMGFGHPGTFGGSSGAVSYATGQKRFGTHSLLKLLNGDYGYLTSLNYTNFTVTGWFRPEALASGDQGFKGIFGNQDTGTVIASYSGSSYYLGLQMGSFTGGNGASGDKYIANAVSCPTISNATWFHYTWTRDGTNTKLYVNGVLGNTITENISTVSLNPSSALYLGTASSQTGNTTYDTQGYHDNIRIFNKKLSDSEVSTLYAYENAR